VIGAPSARTGAGDAARLPIDVEASPRFGRPRRLAREHEVMYCGLAAALASRLAMGTAPDCSFRRVDRRCSTQSAVSRDPRPTGSAANQGRPPPWLTSRMTEGGGAPPDTAVVGSPTADVDPVCRNRWGGAREADHGRRRTTFAGRWGAGIGHPATARPVNQSCSRFAGSAPVDTGTPGRSRAASVDLGASRGRRGS